MYRIDFNILSEIIDNERIKFIQIYDEIELISVEDKLTYTFPNDIIFDDDDKRVTIESAFNFWYNFILYHHVDTGTYYKLEELSIKMQLEILNNRYGTNWYV